MNVRYFFIFEEFSQGLKAPLSGFDFSWLIGSSVFL